MSAFPVFIFGVCINIYIYIYIYTHTHTYIFFFTTSYFNRSCNERDGKEQLCEIDGNGVENRRIEGIGFLKLIFKSNLNYFPNYLKSYLWDIVNWPFYYINMNSIFYSFHRS